MKIQGTLKKRRVATRSKSPRIELFISHGAKEYILKSSLSTPFHPDPELLKLENLEVQLEGYVIAGTNVFKVTDKKIM